MTFVEETAAARPAANAKGTVRLVRYLDHDITHGLSRSEMRFYMGCCGHGRVILY